MGLTAAPHRPPRASAGSADEAAPAPKTPSIDWDGHGPIVFAASCNEASNAIACATIGEGVLQLGQGLVLCHACRRALIQINQPQPAERGR